MKATRQAEKAIYDLFIESQDPEKDIGFRIDAGINIYNYQPGDFTIDGQDVNNGAYVYFSDTVFDPGEGGKHDQSHDPMIHIDLYASAKATRSTATNEVTFSLDEAHLFMWQMLEQIYAAVSHAAFRRLIEEKVDDSDFTPALVTISRAKKIGVLRIPDSSTSIACSRFVCTVGVCELHGTTTGIPLDKINDHLYPTTKAHEDAK